MNSFCSYDNCMMQVLLSCHFANERTEVERGEVTSFDHRASSRQPGFEPEQSHFGIYTLSLYSQFPCILSDRKRVVGPCCNVTLI